VPAPRLEAGMRDRIRTRSTLSPRGNSVDRELCMNRSIGLLIAIILICCSSGRAAWSDNTVALSSWWQTGCSKYSSGELRAIGIEFREFPMTNVDTGRLRSITFDKNGLTVKSGGRLFGLGWTNVKIDVNPLGNHKVVFAMTVFIKNGRLEDDVFGNVELVCWRDIEELVESFAPGHITGSFPIPKVPLRNPQGEIIHEEDKTH
jgi:hypothetical protein